MHFALFFAEARAGMAVQACFSPLGRCSSHILRELGQAQREILVAIYAFTNDELAWALVKARHRGVKVQVILDQEFHLANESSKGSFLEQQGLAVRRISGLNTGKRERGTGLMHQKFAVIDRRVVLTGSYNWTVSADNYNDENLLLFRDAGPLAEEYRKEFFRLWEKKQ
ncbi:MAG: phospholipase D family protein [Deltaproteobacteria bacterium]|nr:phospholipase D family protein [Deltaproteobacteria bacterium]